MNRLTVCSAFSCLFLLVACGGSTLPPKQLLDARAAFATAANGPALEGLAAAELHVAKNALDEAEHSFSVDGDTPDTRDFAYIALRKVELADAAARVQKKGSTSTPSNSAATVAESGTPKTPKPGAPAPVVVPEVRAQADQTDFGFVAGSPQSTSYALVVGIERYRDVPRASGARHDAMKFASMLRKTLGLREDHVVVALDDRATRTDLLKNIEWLKQSVKPGGRAYVYFSGHGAPDAGSGTTFMLPFDGDPKYVATTAIAVDEIVKALAGSQAQEALVIADTCFSGAGGRSQLAAGTRPLVKVKEPAPAARVTMLSASGGSEISGPTKAGDEGLFSHHLSDAIGKGLADVDGDGQITLQEVLDWVKPRVSREAKRDNRDQTPELRLGTGVRSASDFIVGYGISGR